MPSRKAPTVTSVSGSLPASRSMRARTSSASRSLPRTTCVARRRLPETELWPTETVRRKTPGAISRMLPTSRLTLRQGSSHSRSATSARTAGLK